uniref:InlB B-repeat-containing protein n=1 Tax=Anaerosporobacter sp. TaxID=1872529 RepID=UPI00286F988C
AAMVSMISIGILCENEEIFSRAVELYQDIHINGSIAVYVSDWGQSVESARDQAHAQLGIGYMADVCAAALNQGINLYDLYNYRLAKAFNWAAQYNLYDTNYTFEPLMNVFNNSSRGYWTTLDSEKINRGELRPVYELPLSYYSNVEGVDVTWMKKAAEAMRAQGYVHNDNLNFGTLTTYNGASTAKSEPYFQIRTAIEPWYQRTYSAVKQYDSSVAAGVAETLNSYFAVSEDGTITASLKKADAPYFQLINNDDGTYALKCVSTDKYVSVKADMVGDENVIKADADTVSDSERFTLKATGIGYYYLASPKYDNRAVTIHVDGADTPTSAVLTMRLSNSTKTSSASVTTSERLIFVYNTKSTVLGVEEENCTVTFNTNDGSKVTAQLVEKGSLVTEPSKTEKTGYEFEGWYKDSSLTQKWDFAKDTVTENVTLYAKWTVKDNGNNDDNGDNDDKKFFTITFNTNGGSTVSSQTIENGNKVTEPSKPEKTGNEFEGWYKDSSLTQKWDFAKDTVTDSIILYAKWIVKNIDNGYNATIIDNETTNTTDSTSKQVIKVETANQEATVSVTINEKAYESELSTVTVKNPYQLKIELPSSTIVNQIKSDSIKNVKVVVTLPNSFIANESIAINDIMLSKQILTAAKENQKTITLVVNDESKKLLYQWTIDADDLAKASITEGISLGIKTAVANTNSVVKKVLENDSKNSNGVVVTVASKKTLSVQVTNKVYIGEQAGIKVGKKVYVYYYNSTTKKLDTIPGGYSCVVDADGYLSLPIIKGGDYVVLAKKANTKVITSLVNQVQITKSVTLKKDKTSTIKPVLPDWLEKVSKLNISTKYTCVGAVTITYKSSNSSVASVGASSGKITAKKKGTATITATVTLYSGKVKTYKTTVTVK